jgi:hypothetical protein
VCLPNPARVRPAPDRNTPRRHRTGDGVCRPAIAAMAPIANCDAPAGKAAATETMAAAADTRLRPSGAAHNKRRAQRGHSHYNTKAVRRMNDLARRRRLWIQGQPRAKHRSGGNRSINFDLRRELVSRRAFRVMRPRMRTMVRDLRLGFRADALWREHHGQIAGGFFCGIDKDRIVRNRDGGRAQIIAPIANTTGKTSKKGSSPKSDISPRNS